MTRVLPARPPGGARARRPRAPPSSPARPTGVRAASARYLEIARDGVRFVDPVARGGRCRRCGSRRSAWRSPKAARRLGAGADPASSSTSARYTADDFVATEGDRQQLRVAAHAAARALCPAVRDARLRAARASFPEFGADPLARHPRLLPPLHGRRAHAARPSATSSRCSARRHAGPRALRAHACARCTRRSC